MSDLVRRLREFRLNDFYESKLVLTQEAADRIEQLEQACMMSLDALVFANDQIEYLSDGVRFNRIDFVISALREVLKEES